MKNVMKVLIAALALVFLVQFEIKAQCDDCEDITSTKDDFDGYILTRVEAENLDGYSFTTGIHANLRLYRKISDKDSTFFLELWLTYPKIMAISEKENTLSIKADEVRYDLTAVKSTFKPLEGNNIYTIIYPYNFNDLKQIIHAKSVKLRFYAKDESLDFSFNEDNFKCYKCAFEKYFVKK